MFVHYDRLLNVAREMLICGILYNIHCTCLLPCFNMKPYFPRFNKQST